MSKRSCTFWQSHSMWMTVSFELLHKLNKLSTFRLVYIMLFADMLIIWYCSHCSLELFVHLKKEFCSEFSTVNQSYQNVCTTLIFENDSIVSFFKISNMGFVPSYLYLRQIFWADGMQCNFNRPAWPKYTLPHYLLVFSFKKLHKK